MPQQQAPWLEGKYGWNFGESGWNSGMDQNLLKFSFMFDGNVDGVVATLPPVTNGAAYFNTADNRFYFGVDNIWYSSPCPKSFIFKIKSNGDFWQFDGTSASKIDKPSEVDARLTSLELTVSSLGSAAFEDSSAFATQAELDIVEANAQAYTDALRQDLADSTDPAKGPALIGFQQPGDGSVPTNVRSKLLEHVSVKDFGAVGDGIADDTAAIQAAIVAHNRVVIPPGIYKTSTAIIQRPNTEVIFEPGASIKLTAPIYHAWFFSGGASVATRLIRPVIDCNLQAGANGIGIGGSGLGPVQNIYVENPVVLNARREPNSGATYSGGGRGMAIESDVRNVQIIAPRFENCTAGFSTQPYTAKPTQGLLIVAPIAINCMHYAEFFDLPDAGTITPSGEMGGAVIIGGYAKNVGRAQADFYSGGSVFDAATDTGAIMCERARWVNWRGFQIYNEASYGSIGAVVRGCGANCIFEGTFAGDSNAIIDNTVSNMLLPVAGGQAVPLRNLQINVTHSGAYNYIHRYIGGSNSNARGLQLRLRAYQGPTTANFDSTTFPGDAYLEWYNFSNGEGFSGNLSSWSGYTLAGSARMVNDRVRLSQALTLNATGTQANPSVSSEANIYVRGGKLIVQYNDAGTVRYKYLDLVGTGVTWVHSTVAP